MNISSIRGIKIVLVIALCNLCLVVLIKTLVPTVYTSDSAELVTGAWTLGIVHPPGYPLYLMLLHAFMRIPVGDIAFRGNLFSALCITLTLPFLFLIIHVLTRSLLIAASITLVSIWSYYVWSVGLFAEIYALQILSLAIVFYVLLYTHTQNQVGTLYLGLITITLGGALAVHPIAILFIPGVLLAFHYWQVSWIKSTGIIAASCFIAASSFFYLPFRFTAIPVLNVAGFYNSAGVFEPIDLRTFQGLLWMATGQRFEGLFFSSGYVPSLTQLKDLLILFWGNYLGFGILLGLVGIYRLYSSQRQLLYVWLLLFIPFTYFYATYGALDKQTMFGPSLLLWAAPLAVGMKFLLEHTPVQIQYSTLLSLPLLMLIVNYPLLDQSHETSIREQAEAIMDTAPEDAYIFASWTDIMPLIYLQAVEDKRPDIHLYNLYLFPVADLHVYSANLTREGAAVWVVGDLLVDQFPDVILHPTANLRAQTNVDAENLQIYQPIAYRSEHHYEFFLRSNYE